MTGTVVIGKASDETDVSTYNLYWASAGATALGPSIASFPKTGSDISYELNGAVPSGATHLIARSANDRGETGPGVNALAVDNFPVFSDITVVTDGGVGGDPSAVVDAVNGKLLVAIRNTTQDNRLGLVHCDLNGTNCKLRDIAWTAGQNSGIIPSAVIDAAGAKLYVATQKGDRFGLFSSNLDGSASKNIGTYGSDIRGLSAALDTVNGKLHVATTSDDDEPDRMLLHRCDLGASPSCSAGKTVSPDGGAKFPVHRYPSTVVDEANGKVIVVWGDSSNSPWPRVARCNLDGTSCTHQVIDTLLSPGAYWERIAVAIDNVNRKLLVVGQNSYFQYKLTLVRCGLDADTSCSFPVDISAGQPEKSGKSPSMVIDTTNGKLLVAAVNPDHFSTMGLFRCNLDGTACTHTDISVGHEKIHDPSAAIDKVSGRLLVAASYEGGKLGLFSLGLW